MMSDDDFSSLLSDEGEEVKPLKTEKRVALKNTSSRDASQSLRQKNAVEFNVSDEDPLESDTMTMLQPLDVLEFQRPGVQHGVYKNLRLGKYPLEARLDLHRHTQEQARVALYRFVQDCLEHDVRSALITHGKGEGRAKPAILKSCVAHWLPQMDEVLAFHTAQKHHGSYGATYILLKKSERKKQQTKEQLKK
jgi:DNA-nicking Smr family endonuclease